MISAEHNVLAVIQKGKTFHRPTQAARPAAGGFARFENNQLALAGQRRRRGQTAPAGTDYRHFGKSFIIHGLNPNNQVFKAIRFLRGPGMAIL